MLSIFLPLNTFAANQPPFTLGAPKNLAAELKFDQDGMPYFKLTLDIPQSVKTINSNLLNNGEYYEGFLCDQVEISFDFKYGKYDWNQGESMYWNNTVRLEDFLAEGYYEYRPFDKGDMGEVDISAETYNFRAYFKVNWGYAGDWLGSYLVSGYSNIVTVGNPEVKYSNRLSGASRIETAIAVAKEGWPNGAGVVILTRDDNYPDALTGAPLAKKLDAPILFTNSKKLTPATEAEIARLKAQKVIILGGTGAVSQEIENQLKQRYTVQRIGGADRYITAKNIALELGYKGKVVITTGLDFHDALVVSPLAAYKGIPILLTASNSLPEATVEALSFVAPTEITVVGNTSSVSEKAISGLANVKRITGTDIYDSAVNVAKSFEANTERIFLATGKAFPDALSGSGLAAKFNSPILFVDDPLSSSVKQYLTDHKETSPKVFLLGGDGAIPKKVQDEVDNILK